MNSLFSGPQLIMAAVVFIASVASGLTGFGFALISVPLLVILLSPTHVVPMTLLLTSASSMMVMVRAWKWIRLRRFLPLMVCGAVGANLGTQILVLLDVGATSVVVGLICIFSSISLLLGVGRPVGNERLGLACVGLLSGVLGGSTSMSGPPVVLFLANQAVEKQTLRANITLYFIAIALSAIPLQIASNLMTWDTVIQTASLVPFLVGGTLIGIRLAETVEEAAFRNLVLAVVVLAGLASIATGLGLL